MAKPNARQLRIVFENVAVGMALAGLDRRLVFCNRALAEMLGYEQSDLTAKRVDDLLHPSDREEALAAFERLARGESEKTQLELRLLRKDGEAVWTRVTGSTVLDEHGKPVFVVGSAEDIGEHKRAEETVTAVQESMERLVETTDAIVVQLNSAGEIQFLNHAFEEITGYSREDLEDKNWFETLVPKERYPEVWDEFQRPPTRGFPARFENPILTKTGEERYIVWSNSELRVDDEITGTLSIGIDITESRRGEKELAGSEARLQTIFRTVPAPIVITELEDGRILDVNSGFEQLLECEADEVVGKTSLELGIWIDPVARTRMVDLITEHGAVNGLEMPFRTLRGNVVTTILYVRPLTVNGKSCLILSATDITERKHAEEALADSEEKLLAVFTSSPTGLAVSGFEDGRVLDVNTEFERLFECRLDDIVGKTSTELGLWADPSDRKRVIDLIDRDGQIADLELPLRTARGRALIGLLNVREVTIRGSRFLIYALRDITERKQIDEQLALLKSSIDSHYDSAYWTDSDNRLVYTNLSACAALGYECEYLVGKPFSLVDPSATSESLEKLWDRLRQDGFVTAESVHRRSDGSEFPVETVSTYVQFGGKEYNCGFARDISERKRQEHERAQLTEQLVQAQKMEAVGRLAGGVAHNFNNILTALIGYCELLLTKLPERADGRQEAEQIKLAADHAATVTRELLLFSRRETGQRVKLDLNAVIVQTRLLLRELIRSDIQIVAALAPIVAPVKANRGQIEQVLVNLVLNASDAMPDGGVIAIDTADLVLDEQLVEGGIVLDPGRYVTLTVKDSGIGMDEATKARIFEPFFSTKRPEQGSGLGLATVYGIVEESGGKILVDSKPNAGTKLTIFFPALPSRN